MTTPPASASPRPDGTVCHNLLSPPQRRRAVAAIELMRSCLRFNAMPPDPGDRLSYTEMRDPGGAMSYGWLELSDGTVGIRVVPRDGPHAGRVTNVRQIRTSGQRIAEMGDVDALLRSWLGWLSQRPLDEARVAELDALEAAAADAAAAAATRLSTGWTHLELRVGDTPFAPSILLLCSGSLGWRDFKRGPAIAVRSLSPNLERLLREAGTLRTAAGRAGRGSFDIDFIPPSPRMIPNRQGPVEIMRAIAKAVEEDWELIDAEAGG